MLLLCSTAPKIHSFLFEHLGLLHLSRHCRRARTPVQLTQAPWPVLPGGIHTTAGTALWRSPGDAAVVQALLPSHDDVQTAP